MIVRGEKTIEGRVAYRSLDRAQEGLPLHFKQGLPGSPVARTLIDWTLRAETFEDALLEVRWQDAIPNVGKFDDALAIYNRIYPPEKVQEIGGVVLLGFTLQDVIRGNASV
jgi:ASC-1-like (ASCH) protein